MSKQIEKKTQTGTLDARNALNDLTGREWVYFLNSIELIEGEPQPPHRCGTQRLVGRTVGSAPKSAH